MFVMERDRPVLNHAELPACDDDLQNASAQELSTTRPQPQDRDSLSCAETAEMQRKTATKQGHPHMK